MKKAFLLKPMLLLFALIVGMSSAWGQFAPVNTILWSETWTGSTTASSASNNATPSANYGKGTFVFNNGTVTYTQSANSVYVRNDTYAGGTAPELMVTSGKTWTISNIPTAGAEELTLTYKSNNTNSSVTCTTTGASITGSSKSYTITTGGAQTIAIVFSCSGNTRLDDIELKVKTAGSLAALAGITLSGTYPTTFTEKDEFSHEGMTVTASYDDNTTSDVTNLATFTGYNMNTVGPQTVTVSYTEGEVTKTATYGITVNAGPKYTVSFNAEGGSCSSEPLTETEYQGGVTLPSATISVAGWVFAGWAESTVSNTTTLPSLYMAGSKYYPTAATTLHAVYTLSASATGTTYTRVTSLDQIYVAKKIAVASSRSTSMILNHNATSNVNAPTESNGEITVTADQMFTLSGDNTTGFVLTGANGTLSQETLSASGANDKPIDWSGTNNKWIIENNTNTTNVFAVRNANSTQVALEYDSGWKTYYVGSYTSSAYTAMKLYVPKTAYNSNPSAITEPSIAFDNGNNGTTLYLDGTKTYTNAAHVTGVSKTINYTSSNTSVATVNSSGVVTAVGIGTATITASVDAELGVSASASSTYDVIVKTTTTINGLKPLSSSSTEENFSADLTDAVVTYVNGNYAYIQDASAAIMVNCSGHGLVAGKKINGAVSGKVKAPNQIDQISSLDLTEATVTTDGVIPEAVTDKTLAQIKNAGTDYDGKLVTINGATVTAGMTDATSGGKISDDNGTTTFNIIAPNNLTLVVNEKGNFTGFVSIYVSGNTTTYRLNIYEEGQFEKTHNAPTAQTLSFANDAIELDEDTEAYSSFNGQQVSGAKGTVSYAITSDANSIISSLNAETGAVVLSGTYGTATIEATAAAIELTEDGVITPYNETTKSYTVSVYPRYSATFSINGVETTLREATHDAGVIVPTPTAAEPYMFVGWSTAEVAETNTKPATVSMGATLTLTADNNGSKYYALYAQAGELQNYTLTYDEIKDNTGWGTYGTSYNYNQASGVTWVIKAYKPTQSPYGMQINTGKNSSIKVPDCPGTIQTVEVTGGASKSVGFSSSDYTGSGTITYLAAGTDATSQTLDLTNESVTTGYVVPKGGNIQITQVKVNFRSFSGYTTSLPNVDVKIGQYKWATFCYNRALDFTNTGVSAYIVTGSEGESTITKEPVTKVPANTGLLLKAEQGTYSIPVTAEETDDVTANKLVPVLTGSVTVNAGTEGNVNYILTVKSGQVVFAWVSSSYSPVVTAGKAYLTLLNGPMPGSDTGAPWLSIDGDEGTTGVQNIERTINDNQYYTLDGRRVETPTKGLYIINGKKVVVK